MGVIPGPEAWVDKIMIAAAAGRVRCGARPAARRYRNRRQRAQSSVAPGRGAYSRAATIYGGTSEIQKDIVGLAAVGLPRSA